MRDVCTTSVSKFSNNIEALEAVRDVCITSVSKLSNNIQALEAVRDVLANGGKSFGMSRKEIFSMRGGEYWGNARQLLHEQALNSPQFGTYLG